MPRGYEKCPSQARKVMVEGENSGDLSCFQIVVDITQVDEPLSIMHQEMIELWTWTGIWKETDEGNGGCSDVLIGKMIRRSSEGSTSPKEISRDFFL